MSSVAFSFGSLIVTFFKLKLAIASKNVYCRRILRQCLFSRLCVNKIRCNILLYNYNKILILRYHLHRSSLNRLKIKCLAIRIGSSNALNGAKVCPFGSKQHTIYSIRIGIYPGNVRNAKNATFPFEELHTHSVKGSHKCMESEKGTPRNRSGAEKPRSVEQ